ncbi:c-type cytochrome biogenesis protein CcsB [Seleniivibrio sp.]|uniref:c-type cytochrome biogenesis protein CcsB n=1 Tax=Seleniivibrio sp. TaxID=2898801 RepID=UPI0025EE8DAF|nr:c-type cytochrome biogenesis protein CcsB [Seleniivibrio sp.]MCD8552361.1 c-type cytochrome biogenesis protein CcsB [Seleniivibrio sp.]
MNSSVLFGIASITYMVTMAVYVAYLILKKEMIGKVASWMTIFGFVCHTAAFLMRWVEFSNTYHLGFFHSVPITNLYESLLFFAWCVIAGNIWIERRYKTKFMGAFLTAIAGMAVAFVDTIGAAKGIQPLVPALKSNWLLAHATMSFIAYAAFSMSFVAAVLHLASLRLPRRSGVYIFWTVALGTFVFVTLLMIGDFTAALSAKAVEGAYKPLYFTFKNMGAGGFVLLFAVYASFCAASWFFGGKLASLMDRFSINGKVMEELTYKMISVGFPIFTVGGLIFGAVWADKAWGRYWSWDPKETWALITWLIYAFYLHARYVKDWTGAKASAVAVAGFVCTIFTYIGVNLLISGLHSYGAL